MEVKSRKKKKEKDHLWFYLAERRLGKRGRGKIGQKIRSVGKEGRTAFRERGTTCLDTNEPRARKK